MKRLMVLFCGCGAVWSQSVGLSPAQIADPLPNVPGLKIFACGIPVVMPGTITVPTCFLLPIDPAQISLDTSGPTPKLKLNIPASVAPAAKTRHWDVLLKYDATIGGWALPAAADSTTVKLWANGVLYGQGTHYTITAGVIKAGTILLANYQVIIDYTDQ